MIFNKRYLHTAQKISVRCAFLKNFVNAIDRVEFVCYNTVKSINTVNTDFRQKEVSR